MEVPEAKIEENTSAKAEKTHRIDSLDLLMYVGLLIITILTIWLFKHRRLRFVHETGLAVIFGLIVGAIIHYTSSSTELTHAWVESTDPNNLTSPPNTLRLRLPSETNDSEIVYQYMYRAVLDYSSTEERELDEKATFNPEVFFNVILPPVIFYAGYSMKHKHFFRNFGAIMTFAFVGTLVSSFAVGGITYVACLLMPSLGMTFKDCLFFGAIISATDPVTILAIFSDLNVDVDLYALVFGESVLNDAVAIVLSETVEGYSSSEGGFDGLAILRAFGSFLAVFFGAFAMGAAMGCITALLTKFTHLKEFPLLETSLFCLMSYATFLAAEAAGLTGIVAVLFCGICQAHYTYNNLSPESQLRTKQLFEVLNFLMENFVFTYIGVSTFTYQHHFWNAGFIIAAFIAIIVGRALNIYPLSFLLNLGRTKKIQYKCQHMMAFAGLRGAMAYALAIRNAGSGLQGRLMFSTTILIVIATVILCGGLTTPMLQWLKIKVGVEDEIEMHSMELPAQHAHDALSSPDSPMAGRLAEKARLVRVWYKVDSRLVKPLLTHAKPPLTETLPRCCLPLGRLLTTDEQLGRTRLETEAMGEADVDLILPDSNGGNMHHLPSRNHSLSAISPSIMQHSTGSGDLQPARRPTQLLGLRQTEISVAGTYGHYL